MTDSEIETPAIQSTPKPRRLMFMAGLASLLFFIAILMMAYEVYLTVQSPARAVEQLTRQQTALAQQVLALQGAVEKAPNPEPVPSAILNRIEALEKRPAPEPSTTLNDALTARLEAVEVAQKRLPTNTPASPLLLKMAALNALELALMHNRPFAAQLEQVKAQFPTVNIDPTLTQFSAKGLPHAAELLAELTANEKALFERIAPAPQDWWEAFQRSISRWVVVEKAGQLHSSPAAVVDQITRALKANDWQRLAQLWQGIPAEARTITPQLNAAIAARASANVLLTDSWQGLKP